MSRQFVSNSSPLIGFERLQQMDVLQALTTKLLIPTAVRQEVFGREPLPVWLVEQVITQPLSSVAFSPRLGLGEREAIVLALEIGECYLLLDDLAARRTAQALGLKVIGTVGLCLLAKQQGLIDAVKPALDRLLASDFRISPRLYHQALATAEEL